ncbi:MAG: hypothetical protein HC893_10695 [Chloroflexaceae bacterium]|nr:hypothetical protein [Chloroflexaceae bacterium]
MIHAWCLSRAAKQLAQAGQRYVIGGILIGLLTPIAILFFYLTGGQTVGSTCFGVLVSWPFATIGVLGWISGQALLTNGNTITVDTEQQTIVYTQQNRFHRLRSQTLHFDQLAGVRLKPRTVRTSGLFASLRSLMVLELVTDEEQVWIVDSASTAEPLQALANTSARILDLALEQADGAPVRG